MTRNAPALGCVGYGDGVVILYYFQLSFAPRAHKVFDTHLTRNVVQRSDLTSARRFPDEIISRLRCISPGVLGPNTRALRVLTRTRPKF